MNLIEKIINAGVVGAGGAGFPTHIKYSTEAEYFIVNAVECEPLIHSDKYITRNYAKEIVDTIICIAEHLKADKIVIAIKCAYKEEIKILKDAIGEKNISIFEMDSFYPAGDEHLIIYDVTGRQMPIGKLPKDVGVIVSNIATIFDVSNALNDISNISKILSVVGEVENPSILETPIGMPVLEVINQVGLNNDRFSLIVGGPMMGQVYSSDEIESLTITKTSNSLIVLPENHYLLQMQNKPLQNMIYETNSACIQCRECTEMCPRFLIGHPLHPHRIMRSISYGNIESNEIFEEALMCCECGVCDYVCPMHLSPRRINQMVKGELAGKKSAKHEIREIIKERDYRRLPTSRLIYMLDIQKYYNQKPETLIKLNTDTVYIELKQHIGATSIPIVNIGDSVEAGMLIAEMPQGALGANIHASISGEVIDANSKSIIIKNKSRIL